MEKFESRTVYLITSLFTGMIFSIVFAANQLYRIQTVGLNPLQLVLVGTTLEIAVFIFEIPTGIIADVYSRKLSVIIGTFLFGIGFLLEGSVPVFGVILLAQVIWGTAWTFISGAHSAWIADEVGVNNVGPIYMRASQFGQIGNLIGIPIFIILGNINYRLPIFVGGILFLVLGVFRLIWMPETGFTPMPKDERVSWVTVTSTFKEGVRLAKLQPILMTFAIITLFVGLYSEGYDRLSEAHLIKQFSFPTLFPNSDPIVLWFALMRVAGLIFSLSGIEIVRRWFQISDNIRTARYLQAIYGLINLGLLAFAFSKNFYLSFMYVLMVDTMRSMTGPLIDTLINRYIESRVRATILSMTAQLDAFGQMVGGPIVGSIGNHFSISAALSISCLLLLPVIPLYQRVIHLAEKSGENANLHFQIENFKDE